MRPIIFNQERGLHCCAFSPSGRNGGHYNRLLRPSDRFDWHSKKTRETDRESEKERKKGEGGNGKGRNEWFRNLGNRRSKSENLFDS